MPIESAHRPLPGLRQMLADSGGLYIANAVIGFIFAASGPVAIILTVGARGGLSESDLSSWIFGSFFISGLITLLFCTPYRKRSGNPSFAAAMKLRTLRLGNQRTRRGEHGSTADGALPGAGGGVSAFCPAGERVRTG